MPSLLELFLTAICLPVMAVNMWVFIKEFLSIHVPPPISNPMKIRLLNFASRLVVTWGTVLEKLRICSLAALLQFIEPLLPLKRNYGALVTNLCFGEVPVRLFEPKTASSSPRRGVIFYHGGGGVMGSLDTHHGFCSFLALETDSVVMAVGYRKLPHHHHPVSMQDCITASIHFLKNLSVYNVDPSRVMVCGESIGGLAVLIVLQTLLSRPDLPRIRAQILIYPMLQIINFQLPSHVEYKDMPFLNRELLMHCLHEYLSIDISWTDDILTGTFIPPDSWIKYRKWLDSDNIPENFKNKIQLSEFPGPFNKAAYRELKFFLDTEVSPMLADDEVIAQFPEALLVTIHCDTVRDDTLLYKKRLEDQGVPVNWYHIEDGFHGSMILFDDKILSFPCSKNILNTLVNFIKGI